MNSSRSDERLRDVEIERARERDALLKKGAKTAIGIGSTALGLGVATSTSIASKIAPFLNQYISPELALKGINKVAPKVGDFLKKGMEKGLNLKDGFDYLKKNLGFNEAGDRGSAKDDRNIIEQYSPELNEYIKKYLQRGVSPLKAGAMAEVTGRFKGAIKKMMKDHKMPFSQILQSIYGSEPEGQEQQPQGQQQQMQAQPQQQGESQGQKDIMAALQLSRNRKR